MEIYCDRVRDLGEAFMSHGERDVNGLRTTSDVHRQMKSVSLEEIVVPANKQHSRGSSFCDPSADTMLEGGACHARRDTTGAPRRNTTSVGAPVLNNICPQAANLFGTTLYHLPLAEIDQRPPFPAHSIDRSHEQKASSHATSTAAGSAAATRVPAATVECGTPTPPWTSRFTKTCKGTSLSRLAWAVGDVSGFSQDGWLQVSWLGRQNSPRIGVKKGRDRPL